MESNSPNATMYNALNVAVLILFVFIPMIGILVHH